jgi:hypothetical protein
MNVLMKNFDCMMFLTKIMKWVALTTQVPVLNMVGANSPFEEESIIFNKKLNPENSEYIKILVSCSSSYLLIWPFYSLNFIKIIINWREAMV